MSDNSPNVIIINRQSILRLSIIIGIMVLSNVVRAAATPATFEYSDLSVLPQEILQGEEATTRVTVKNVGDETGSHTVDLLIDGQLEDSTDLTLGAGDQTTVIFQFTADMEEGSHTATLGELTTTFAIQKEPMKLPVFTIATISIIIVIVIAYLARTRII